jgi:predicted HNH restriction endonuclease
MDLTKKCTNCKEYKSIELFYKQKTHRLGIMSFCSACFNKMCIERWIKRKIDAIIYKGSKCLRCELHFTQSHYSVFEFHHRNPLEKDVSWNKLRLKSLDKIKNELDKCDLLCANCHRIVHSESEGFPEQPKSR